MTGDSTQESYCYCGIAGEPCDAWHEGLCTNAWRAPRGSEDWCRWMEYNAFVLRSNAARYQGWLRWRVAWTGAPGPHGPDGTPWYEDALDGGFPPAGFMPEVSSDGR